MPTKASSSHAPLRHQHFQNASSGDGKKLRTRALLLDTAIAVIARKGIEAASILEITEAAGMSNGSFYYHFPSKEALVEAAGGAVAATLVRDTDAAMADLVDGAERVASGTIYFIRRGVADPSWGRLIVHALAEMGEFREQISAGIRKDVQIGVDQGHFDVQPSPALHAVLLGIVSACMHEILEDPSAEGLDQMAAQAILRVLGMKPKAAATLSKRAVERVTRRPAGTA